MPELLADLDYVQLAGALASAGMIATAIASFFKRGRAYMQKALGITEVIHRLDYINGSVAAHDKRIGALEGSVLEQRDA